MLIRVRPDGYIAAREDVGRPGLRLAKKPLEKRSDGKRPRMTQRNAGPTRAAAEELAFEQACTERGGYTSGIGTCLIEHEGWAAQIVTLHPDGTFDAAQAEQNRADCEIAVQDAEVSAADGWPWSRFPEYHEDTGVCVFGSP